MKNILFGLIFLAATSSIAGVIQPVILSDTTLKNIVVEKVNHSNPSLNLEESQVDIGIPESFINPYYAGLYQHGDARELTIDVSDGKLNCILNVRQHSGMEKGTLSLRITVQFQRCDSLSIKVPQPITYYLKSEFSH